MKTYVSKYDSKRNRTGAREMDAGGSVQWNETVSRNAFGATIQERMAMDGSLLYRLSWFDTRHGFRMMDITNCREGLPASRSRQIYNEHGQIMLADGYAGDGQPENRVVFDYGPDSNLLASTSYAPDGRVLSRRIETYDANRDRTSATEFAYDSSGGMPGRTEYTYGPDGLVSSISRSGMGGLNTGLQISYELDEQRNWTRQTTSHCHAVGDESGRMWDDPKPCEVTIRTITYYPASVDTDSSARQGSLSIASSISDNEGGKSSMSIGGGTLTGKVTFSGVPPAPKIFSLSKFSPPGYCERAESDGHGNRVIQEVNIGTDHALRDVVIAVQDVPMEQPVEFGGTKVINEGCKWLVQGGPSTLVGVV
ncbi:MAG TPA: hypothetical protein VFN94_01140, partial [Nitrospiria bacterium]|nr:hypothetical protein [Nitrospiria bacterium]